MEYVPVDVEYSFMDEFEKLPADAKKRLAGILIALRENPLLEPDEKDESHDVRVCDLGDGWKFGWSLVFQGSITIKNIVGYLVYEQDILRSLTPNLQA